jgi:hypothetical protein
MPTALYHSAQGWARQRPTWVKGPRIRPTLKEFPKILRALNPGTDYHTERGCVRGEGAPAAAFPKFATRCGWSSTQPRSGGDSRGGLYQFRQTAGKNDLAGEPI